MHIKVWNRPVDIQRSTRMTSSGKPDCDVIDGAYLQSASDHRFQGVTVPELEHAMNIISESKAGALDVVGCNPTLEFGGQGRTATQWAAWMAFRFMMPHL